MPLNSHDGVCVVCVPDIYQKKKQLTNKQTKNQGKNFPISTPNAFCVSMQKHRWDPQCSLSWSNTKELMGRVIHPWVLTQYKKKRRKWAEETAIVPPLTSLSNYARVKAQVTRKIILVVNHLPCFVYIKEALVLTTFRSHSFPPTFKTHQVASLAKIWIKWLHYGEHLFANQDTGLWFWWLWYVRLENWICFISL